MKLAYRPGQIRGRLIWLWLAYVLVLAYTWLGVFGIAMVVASHPYWVGLVAYRKRMFALPSEGLQRAWITPWAICVQHGGKPHWLCVDEASPGDWAGLHRQLRTQPMA